ncbi:hypothetical protein RN346_06110 [Halomonas sp. PAMB 3232]|uniref:hypothetical protein n=1 Tax=Halomonas sp. PAMB 3232 TaxID=3075221 RepID=UPI0028968730|nr:hypothetical protein [Halomonas sp. PAMB 3232]WNL40135.1 hypothetical protein RN346_06110 [Halomonas sp. PAMB 3232]
MVITQQDAVLGLTALMFGQSPGTASYARLTDLLAANPSFIQLAGDLARTDTFAAQFAPQSTRQDKIDLVLARLGLEEGSPGYTRGSDFINQRLNDGISVGQVMLEISETLLADALPRGLDGAAQVLDDAIAASKAHLAAGIEANALLAMAGPTTPALLAQRLETLKAAQQERAAFLEEIQERDSLAPFVDAAANAVGALEAFYQNAASAVVQAAHGAVAKNLAERSSAVQQIFLDDARQQADSAVATAEAGVKPGVVAAFGRFEKAYANLRELVTKTVELGLEYQGRNAYFEALNPSYLVDFSPLDEQGNVFQAILFNTQTQQETKVLTVTNGAAVTTIPRGLELAGLDSLLEVLIDTAVTGRAGIASERATGEAMLALIELQTGKQGLTEEDISQFVITSVLPDENGAPVLALTFREDTAGALAILQQAHDNQRALADAIDTFDEARELRETLSALDTQVASAEEAVSALGYELKDFANAESANQNDDLYLFVDSTTEANAVTLTGFGEQGVDTLYFGEAFKAVKLEAGQSITDRLGSADQLEIFWRQDGDDLTLFVEAHPTGGNATDTADITQVTLTGVNVADAEYANGFLTVSSA